MSFGAPPSNRWSSRPVDSSFVHSFQTRVKREISTRGAEDPLPADPLMLPGMRFSQGSTTKITPVLKIEDGDTVRGDSANHKWTDEELRSPVKPLCVAPQQTLGYVPLGLGAHGEREFNRKVRPGEIFGNAEELRQKQKRVISLKNETAAVGEEIQQLELKLKKKQIENQRRGLGIPQKVPFPQETTQKCSFAGKGEFDECLHRRINNRRTHIIY
jgi:hypothetical protein